MLLALACAFAALAAASLIILLVDAAKVPPPSMTAVRAATLAHRLKSMTAATETDQDQAAARDAKAVKLVMEFAADERRAMSFRSLAAQRWPALAIAGVAALVAAAGTGGILSATRSLNFSAAWPMATPSELAAFMPAGPTMADGQKLADFLNGSSAPAPAANMSGAAPAEGALPGVETMITRLAARLKTSPNDVEGWRMLGWSYFHTSRFAEAAKAYEQAVALAPGDSNLKSALAEAVAAGGSAPAAIAATEPTTQPAPTGGPSAADIAAAASMPDSDRTAMIRGMVDGLAARLAQSPKDEAGWIKLMRARMVLAEPDGARAALVSARTAFAGDSAALARLEATAAELGLAQP